MASLQTIEQPLRSELFSIDLLQRHAQQLAQRHRITRQRWPNHLLPRLARNEKVLCDYNEQTLLAEKTRRITPAAEWLLDNFYLIEEQIRMARHHLPRRFNRELPHLAHGTSAELPRVYDLAQELISHVDGRIDSTHLTAFIAAYQQVTPLKLGELWAIPIMLRLALIENLRRVAVLLAVSRKERARANVWADRLLDIAELQPAKLIVEVGDLARMATKLTPAFVTEFWRRMQEKSSHAKLVLGWIEECLAAEGHTVEQMIQSESQRQAADQVSVGNSITSFRFLDVMDWREFVESLSKVEQTLRTDPSGVYPGMDFGTRDASRHIIERVARISKLSEWEVARLVIGLCQHHGNAKNRRSHVGYYLLDNGVSELERVAGAKLPASAWLPRLARKFPLFCYVGSIMAIAAAVAYGFLQWPELKASPWTLLGTALLIFLCATQLGVALVNWFVTVFAKPRLLPRLDYSKGVPSDHSTLVVVPTILNSPQGIENLMEGLEVRYLANRDKYIFFALLTDFRDAASQHLPDDQPLLERARKGIEALNQKYASDRPCIFFLFHRPRLWNEKDRIWMGYERKRGKLGDLNAFLRGKRQNCFSEITGDVSRLPRIKYVITLDTDTQLPREAARQLVGTMAHPLNHPVYDAAKGRVREGYSILQPRVGVSLPSASRSRFARLFSGDPGIDPYTRSVSDVYQDLFQEGTFIGKGIYDVDAFELAVGGRFPENRILSHDLLESSYARSALVTDVQLFEEFPAYYTTDTIRRHRWMRGDWQIASWLLPRVPGSDVRRVANPISGLSRWKIFDNLRRSLIPPVLIALLILGWTIFEPMALAWSLLVGAIVFVSGWVSSVSDLLRKAEEVSWRMHCRNVARGVGRNFGQSISTLIFLPYDTCISLDAAIRTLGRLLFTRRHLLEWQTSHDAEKCAGHDLKSYFYTMWVAPAVAVLITAGLMMSEFHSIFVALPFLLLWASAPLTAWWISKPVEEEVAELSTDQTQFLRTVARKTWRYFETFAGDEDNWLPPDNFQEYPRPAIASRTSPTNVGLGMLSTLAAWDFGYIPMRQLTRRVSNTLQTLEKLERYGGHFYNWYDTRTLQTLHPPYISTVDNGNFAGLLLTLRAGLMELARRPWPTTAVLGGLRDTLHILRDESQKVRDLIGDDVRSRLRALEDRLREPSPSLIGSYKLLKEARESIAAIPPIVEQEDTQETVWWRKAAEQFCVEHLADFEGAFPWLKLAQHFESLAASNEPGAKPLEQAWQQLNASGRLQDLPTRLAALNGSLQTGPLAELGQQLKEALLAASDEAKERRTLLESLAGRCDSFAHMDFSLLYDPARKLFSIGYNAASHRLDGSYYDLLASEARLASFVAISLGQVPQEHWFVLGRLLTCVDGRHALISWSGSMFEYLMPLLVMPSYEQTLLDASCRSAVARQIDYGRQMGVPWGVSESGYNLTDAHSNYQYRAFGVPGLGFKRGLSEDVVVAPYASTMALMVSPQEACANLERLRKLGAEGKFGFYEALDYTPARLPRGKTHALVQSFMAHHQGMAFLAFAHHLLDRQMQRRFQANPFFKAAELLLQERIPRETSLLYPHELEMERTHTVNGAPENAFRVFTNPNSVTPEVHLLSNGRYHVMVTNAGGGYSLWHDVALTRWREDTTRDCWGMFIYLRDVENGSVWATTYQPALLEDAEYEAIFSQGRAEFRTRANKIDSHVEIAVSPEDDVEVRRITLTNQSSSTRIIELTSFAEVALNAMGADVAHPAFSKLFIQTEILRDRKALIFSRRPRARGEQPPWMFQLMILHGEETGQTSFETDRAKFLGRGRTVAAPAAMDDAAPLSNTEGSVLDPCLSIRRTLKIPPKENTCVTLVTGSAGNRDALLGLVAKYQDQSIADRVFELAWTHGMVTLRHLNATEPQAQIFGRLAGALLYNHSLRRANPEVLAQNRRGQKSLWSYGISGDLPIVLARCTKADEIGFIREILQAHTYWRMKGLMVELVVVNEDVSGYRQSIHDQIMALIASGIEAQMLDKPGGIFVRRADQLSSEDYILLQAVARIVLSDENGSLLQQMDRRARKKPPMSPLVPQRSRRSPITSPQPLRRDLLFFNGLGGFTENGREYVITLQTGRTTPAPWVNVMANRDFGCLISESGSAYSWSENCHEFRLTPWHNDPVTDSSGEAFYIRDEETGRFWSPTAAPSPGTTPYITRHGFGYSIFEHQEDDISSELWIYVAADAPVKFARFILRNLSERERSLSITGYWEWVLGEMRHKNSMHVVTELEASTGAILARNAYNSDFEGRTAFVTVSESARSWTCDRTEFLGRNGNPSSPDALKRIKLSGKTGAGLDACTALQAYVTLQRGEEHEVIFKLGAGRDRAHALSLLQTFRRIDACRDAIFMVRAHWNNALGAVRVETPDPALNVLANGWLLYQTIACRLWARTGFYQSSGAFGFRDQLQDTMALVHSQPQLLREQLLRAAAHQFRAGDVQHWWHPPSDRGVRTHFSDDYLWLPYATCRYVTMLGDTGVLDESVPFIEGRPLKPEEESYYDKPHASGESATLYEHCVRAIRYGLKFGEHGLPLIGCGDWNDGMNLVGEHGKGESVWLAFFLCDVLKCFSKLARKRGDLSFANECEKQLESLRTNIEQNAWDGEWYRRAYFDDGTPLGSSVNDECQIDSLPQSWAALTGVGDTKRVATALQAVNQHLVRRQKRLIQLFDPPFDKSSLEPGYIKGYVPGVRENGGQYTHAAIWTIMAFAKLGDVERAWELFHLINPVLHAGSPEAIQRYKVEPYVAVADVYSVAPHTGRGGWTWYTGSAGWLYRLIVESFLGMRLDVDKLHFTPCLPDHWSSFTVTYRYHETVYEITLSKQGSWTGTPRIILDGNETAESFVPLKDDHKPHKAEVRF